MYNRSVRLTRALSLGSLGVAMMLSASVRAAEPTEPETASASSPSADTQPPETDPPSDTATAPAAPDSATASGEAADTDAESPDVPAPEEEKAEAKWHDALSFGVFADAYYSANFLLPASQPFANFGRAYDQENGFGLAWAGLEAAYSGEKAGATLSLRLGQGPSQGWGDANVPGSQFVKQAFVTWKPHERVAIDFGRFDTVFGAEVAESWLNHNYTRGMLYNLMQPFWHTGLKVTIQAHDLVAIKLLAVNGWNTIVDNNIGKSFGFQVAAKTRNEIFAAYVGYLGGPERPDKDPNNGERVLSANKYWRHLIDVVMTVNWKRLSLALNGDYIYDSNLPRYGASAAWYGVMASASVRLVDWFYIGARGEFLVDADRALSGAAGSAMHTGQTIIGTGTGTLDFHPAEKLTIRVEGRYDGSNNDIFLKGAAPQFTKHQATVTVGLAVRSF